MRQTNRQTGRQRDHRTVRAGIQDEIDRQAHTTDMQGFAGRHSDRHIYRCTDKSTQDRVTK